MPLTKSGHEVMGSMKKQYGKRGKEVFYATMNKMNMKKKWEGGHSPLHTNPMPNGGEPNSLKFVR